MAIVVDYKKKTCFVNVASFVSQGRKPNIVFEGADVKYRKVTGSWRLCVAFWNGEPNRISEWSTDYDAPKN